MIICRLASENDNIMELTEEGISHPDVVCFHVELSRPIMRHNDLAPIRYVKLTGHNRIEYGISSMEAQQDIRFVTGRKDIMIVQKIAEEEYIKNINRLGISD